MLIIRSWLCPKCTFILLYTTRNLKACKIYRVGVRSYRVNVPWRHGFCNT